MPNLLDLGPGDAPALARFECRSFGEPWSAQVQELIRNELPEAIARGVTNGIGLWSDAGELVGVVAWLQMDGNPDVASIPVLSVAVGHHRQGYGLTLKTEVLARARRAGCVVALSSVHEDNEPMLRLNQRLGARLERDPAHPTYLDCTIDL